MATTSRRRFLLSAAGTAAVASGCASQRTAAEAEAIGAFPVMPGGDDLIGPAKGVARLHSNENPYGPAQVGDSHDGLCRRARVRTTQVVPLTC